jgi:hypothetical protein
MLFEARDELLSILNLKGCLSHGGQLQRKGFEAFAWVGCQSSVSGLSALRRAVTNKDRALLLSSFALNRAFRVV